MQCRDDGLLDLDDPIGKHLDVPAHGDATIRRLLSHTAGFQREPHGDVWDTAGSPGRRRPAAELDRAERVLPNARPLPLLQPRPGRARCCRRARSPRSVHPWRTRRRLRGECPRAVSWRQGFRRSPAPAPPPASDSERARLRPKVVGADRPPRRDREVSDHSA